MQNILKEIFTLPDHHSESTNTALKYVLYALYFGIVMGVSLMAVYFVSLSWRNFFLSSVITVVGAYSAVILRAGRLRAAVSTPALFAVFGVIVSVTFGSGLKDPGIILLLPLLSTLAIFIARRQLLLLGLFLSVWLFILAFLEVNQFYYGRVSSLSPFGLAIIIALIMLFSLTLHRMMYQRVVQSNKELEQAMMIVEEASHAKSNFLATMSHELRTPLNAVIGYSEAIIEEVNEDGLFEEVHMEDLSRINKAGQDLLRMINGILDLSKIEANQMTLSISRFSLHDLCVDVIDTVRPMASKNNNGIVADIRLAREDAMIETDRIKLRQILVNLVTNGAKYTLDGEVKILVQVDPDHMDQFSIDVIDNGIGIPPEKLPLIFDPFHQVDNTLSRSFSGTGLGLAISKKLTELLNGDISVQSEVGAGSCFSIKLPSVIEVETAAYLVEKALDF